MSSKPTEAAVEAFPDARSSPEAWSSDSRHVVCTRYEGGILILDTVDGTVTPLADAGSRPSWSPDGTTIAFLDEYKLYVIPAVGGTRQRLGVRKLAQFAAPAWSPDSQRLAYVSVEANDRYSLWTIRADGSGGRRLAQKVWEDTPQLVAGRLSHRLHEGASPTMPLRLDTVRGDGSDLHQVSDTRGGEWIQHPAWSADGLVLYERGRFRGSQESDIYAVPPTGRGGRALTHPFPAGGTNIARGGSPAFIPPARRSFRRPWPFPSRGRPASTRRSHGWRRTAPGRCPGLATDGSSAADDLERCDRARSTRTDSLRRPLRAGIPRARGQSARLDMCRGRQHVLRSRAQDGACG